MAICLLGPVRPRRGRDPDLSHRSAGVRQNARMDFVLTTPDGTSAIKGSFKIKDNGVLIVDDPSSDRRTSYSPAAWFKVEQKIPAPPPAPAMPRAATGNSEPLGGF